MRNIALLMLILVGLPAVVTDSGRAAQPPDIPQSYLLSGGGALTPLRSATTYRASQFPIPLRLKPGAGGWSGAQWKSGRTISAAARRRTSVGCMSVAAPHRLRLSV